VITIHQRYRQTDKRTDRQTTCDRNTALCTKVHRAVKIYEKYFVDSILTHKIMPNSMVKSASKLITR